MPDPEIESIIDAETRRVKIFGNADGLEAFIRGFVEEASRTHPDKFQDLYTLIRRYESGDIKKDQFNDEIKLWRQITFQPYRLLIDIDTTGEITGSVDAVYLTLRYNSGNVCDNTKLDQQFMSELLPIFSRVIERIYPK